jgi:hypothetical protein
MCDVQASDIEASPRTLAEFLCLWSSTVAIGHTKVNCVLDLGCLRCPIDDIGVVVFM